MGTPCVGNAPWSSGVDGEAVSARLGACAGEQGRNAGRACSGGPWPEPWATPPGAAERKDGRGGSCWGPAAHPAPAPRRALPAGPRTPCAPRAPAPPRQPSADPSTLATCLLRTGRESTELAGCRRRHVGSPVGRGVGGGERHARGRTSLTCPQRRERVSVRVGSTTRRGDRGSWGSCRHAVPARPAVRLGRPQPRDPAVRNPKPAPEPGRTRTFAPWPPRC